MIHEKQIKKLAIRAPARLLEQLDAAIAELERFSPRRPTRSEIVRAALERGIPALVREHGKE